MEDIRIFDGIHASLFRYPVSNIGTHPFLLIEEVDFATT